ncbi:hypothetical protein JW906_05570 [bacterium]|nr:hypothetical protein [bacterium]
MHLKLRFYLRMVMIPVILPALFGCKGVKSNGQPPPEASVAGSAASSALSGKSLSYARGLGGSPHPGEALFLIVGSTAGSETDAQALLEDALPLFGDMQPYFIVQRSGAFEGLDPGQWIVMEAYREQPSAENVQFAQRAFPNAAVKQVLVRTEDPIPVYEDMTGE